MKKIFKLFVAVSLLFNYACNDNADFSTDDYLTGTATEGGAIVAVKSNTVGKLLGVPSSQDFKTATVSFAESSLNLEIILMSGGNDVKSYEIVKTLNGGAEVVVATSTTLPISTSFSTTEEFTEGFGVTEDDLRIGDIISFRTKIIKNDGSANYSNEGTYNVTVSCSSNLARTYDVAVHYTRASPATDTWIYFQDTLTETGVGQYRSTRVGHWTIAALGGTPGFTLEDLCGSITIPEQNLVDLYSNLVEGSGSVDGDTGVITLDYTICATDCRIYSVTYTPVN